MSFHSSLVLVRAWIEQLNGNGEMMVIMWVMYQKAEINEVWKGHCWNTMVSGEDDVEDSKETGEGAMDNMRNFIVEVKSNSTRPEGKGKISACSRMGMFSKVM